MQFSAKIADPSNPLPSDITTEKELQVVIEELRGTVFSEIKLWEFYVLDVISSLQEFRTNVEAKTSYTQDLFDHEALKKMTLKEKADTFAGAALTGGGTHGNRYHKKITTATALSFMSALLGLDVTNPKDLSVETICEEYKTILNEVNLEFYKAYDKDVETIIKNIESRIKYIRLDEHGPKLGPITEE